MSTEKPQELHPYTSLYTLLQSVMNGIDTAHAISTHLSSAGTLPSLHTKDIERRLNYAAKKQYVRTYGSNPTHYHMTLNGERRLAILTFQHLQFNPASWDRKWRLVLFDIPESKRKERDVLRRLIKLHGMKQLQQSVWVTPLACEQEFSHLTNVLGLDTSVLLITAAHQAVFEDYMHYWNI